MRAKYEIIPSNLMIVIAIFEIKSCNKSFGKNSQLHAAQMNFLVSLGIFGITL
jgi:hypothetical protein